MVRDWPERFAGFRAAAMQAQSPTAFAAVAADVLAGARDVHLWLWVEGRKVETYTLDRTGNRDEALLRVSVPNVEVLSDSVCLAMIAREGLPPVGYISISGWPADPVSIEPAIEFVSGLAARGVERLVIDVRGNEGGAEATARRFASHLLREQTIYARHRFRDRRAPDGWGRWRNRVIAPAAPSGDGARRFEGQVVVLFGPRSLSATESFLLMMRHGARAVLIGETSGGSSGNPKPFDLGNGVVAYIPMWEIRCPDGSLLEGRGVAPDLGVRWKPQSGSSGDPMVEAALDIFEK
ncbi:MAG: S41 family peptidase [Opitutaceae bacterium]